MKKNTQRKTFMKNKTKTYIASALLLTLTLTFLRVISLAAFYDSGVGYFKPSLIPLVMNGLFALAAAWCLSSIFTVKAGEIETVSAPQSLPMQCSSIFAFVLFVFASLSVIAGRGGAKAPLICALTLLLSSLFFIIPLAKQSKLEGVRSFLSIAPIAAFVIILASLYFDITITMNSPHKVLGSFALMSAMVFSLCETRIYLDKPLHRLHFAFSLLTFVLGIPYVLSSAIFLLTAKPSAFVTNPIVLGNIGYVCAILGISVFAIARAFGFTQPEILEESADKEATEGTNEQE